MTRSSDCVLLADIGATNARFAVAKNGVLGPITNFKVAEFASFLAALHTFYRENCSEQPVHQAMVAIAGPVKNGHGALTNAAWVIDAEEVQSEFDLKTTLMNDFEAVAYSVPVLTALGDVESIGSGKAEPSAPIAVLGPGSGLGVACLISRLEKPQEGDPVVAQAQHKRLPFAGCVGTEPRPDRLQTGGADRRRLQ